MNGVIVFISKDFTEACVYFVKILNFNVWI